MTDIFKGTFTEAMNIRNLLENINIDVFGVISGGFNPITLQLKAEDFESAKKDN